ncbi:MAG: SIS domain-containing protein [Chloroflexi bacterium]|nr:SIS domain-containing protein [Chloroflexota bacterium]
MQENPYIKDILSQPAALRATLSNYPADQIEPLRKRLDQGDFSRIVLTGMGSSFYSAYPAWLGLLPLSTPAVHINTAEALHYGQGLIDSRTLLWINSQSGYSVEIVRFLEKLKGNGPAFQFSMTNHLDSPMAQMANLVVPIHAGEEATVSTKTFINMMATLKLASVQLAGGDWQTLLQSMRKAADGIESYLEDWRGKVAELDALLGTVDQLLILGRGASMAAVWNGSLINKEAAKCVFDGMNVADFRHGPMELASPRLTLLMMQGASQTASLNRELALEVTSYGGRVLWIATQPDPQLPTLQLPAVDESAQMLVEILPLQMLTILMAHRTGFEPGKFRHITKVTLQE